MRKLILAVLTAVMIPAVALAQGFPGGGPGGQGGSAMRGSGGGQGAKGARMAQELGLTDEQVAKMREIHQTKRRATIDQKANIQKAMLDLTDELAKDKPDQAALERIIEKIVKTKADMERDKLNTMVAVSAILTPEQKKIAAERMANHSMMGDKRQGQRSGQRGMRPGGPGGGPGDGPGGGPGLGN
ncbi:MAG: periplasmic heavy metal sensor [Nitrospinota bacterium]|nr:periplasmic heavy metal sensor [Nitrospinota bacterium]